MENGIAIKRELLSKRIRIFDDAVHVIELKVLVDPTL